MKTLRIENMTKAYGDHKALDDVTLSLSKGEVLSIIGPSGSGKTSLLRMVANLETIDQGRVLLDDEQVTWPNQDSKTHPRIGYVFQNFNLFLNLNVMDNITLGLIHTKGLSKKDAEAKALTLLRQFSLESKKDRYVSDLSGGEKQRIAIIRALALDPEILLFDEPTSALDPENVKEVQEAIKLLTDRSITIVLVTHEVRFAKQVSDRLAFMDEGKLVVEGPTQSVLKNQPKRLEDFLNALAI
ncbi:MAG: amino acid ABC transporter ATP-binding protein [Bacillota bacterium]